LQAAAPGEVALEDIDQGGSVGSAPLHEAVVFLPVEVCDEVLEAVLLEEFGKVVMVL
jgi:hypothetical protein